MYYSDMRNEITRYAFGNELAWLREKAKEFNYATMIGAGPGIMGIALMEGNPLLNLLVIDIETCYYVRKHMDEAGFPMVGYVVDDSSEYGKDYAGPKLDFLLVDGDHSEQGVTNDVHAWLRHIKKGGLLFFHDYKNINDDLNNGVAQALTKLIENGILKVEIVDTPGISMVYRKL